jgi:predicted Rossmann fold nucleotide-binding protein DprA/Smf involved in DNA uptake
MKRKGLEMVLDATTLNELTIIESAVKSHQQRIQALQKTRETLRTLDKIGYYTNGIKYITLESEGIPEHFYSYSNKPLLENEALFL